MAGRRCNILALLPVAAATFLLFGTGAAAVPDKNSFRLSIQPHDGAAWSLACTVDDGALEETFDLASDQPLTRDVTGDHLTCRITQTSAEGSIEVEITGTSGNRSRSRTNGAGSTMMFSVR